MNLDGKQTRIGIYAGTFDPVHAGHLSFALHAQEMAKLDEVYFLPERMPRHKPGAEHYGHRVAMIKRAIVPHESLSLLELVDKRFTLARTMPQLHKVFADSKIVLLMGTDVFMHVPAWSQDKRLRQNIEFVVSVHNRHELPVIMQTAGILQLPTKTLTIVDSLRPDVSSSQVRLAISLNETVRGLLPSVQNYAAKQWLYVRVPKQQNA